MWAGSGPTLLAVWVGSIYAEAYSAWSASVQPDRKLRDNTCKHVLHIHTSWISAHTIYYTCLHISSILYVFKADMYGSCVSIWKPSSHWHYPNESNSDFKQTWICTQWCSTPTVICVVWKKTSWQNCNFLPEFMHFNLLLQPLSLLWEAFHEMLEHEWRDLFLIVASETAKPVN